MSGIAGIARTGERKLVNRMLDKIAHRGPAGRAVVEANGATLGVVWTEPKAASFSDLIEESLVQDAGAEGHLAEAQATSEGLTLVRDQLGRAPLYHGQMDDDTMCFASEVKAMLEATHDVNEVPPARRLFNNKEHKCNKSIRCYNIVAHFLSSNVYNTCVSLCGINTYSIIAILARILRIQ